MSNFIKSHTSRLLTGQPITLRKFCFKVIKNYVNENVDSREYLRPFLWENFVRWDEKICLLTFQFKDLFVHLIKDGLLKIKELMQDRRAHYSVFSFS